MTKRLALLLVLLGLAVVPVAAQDAEPTRIEASDRPFELGIAIGPGLNLIHTTSGDASTVWVPRFAFRFFPNRAGWSPASNFGWFNTSLHGEQFGGGRRPIGELQVRPIMGGVRYTWIRDQLSYDVAATAGFSFTDFDLDGAVAKSLGVPDPIKAEANTAFATKLQGGVWYDYTDRVSFRATVALFRCTPEVTVSGVGYTRSFQQSANALELGVSVVYRIF